MGNITKEKRRELARARRARRVAKVKAKIEKRTLGLLGYTRALLDHQKQMQAQVRRRDDLLEKSATELDALKAELKQLKPAPEGTVVAGTTVDTPAATE